MLKKIIIPALLMATALFYSCGASKKLESANAEIEQLKATNSKLTANVSELQNQVASLTDANKKANAEFNSYKADCEVSKQKLKDIQDVLTDLDNSLDAMQAKIDEAMANFKDKGVEVFEKDGLVYVNMQDNLIYKSGSSALSDEGKKALGALASALNDYPKLKVYVVGNTDDVKFKKANSDNLSLSTERANGVVRVLRDDYQVDPTRLTAAGKGKYAPVADNSTPEGRARNRRTEIILNPDLERLWDSVQKY